MSYTYSSAPSPASSPSVSTSDSTLDHKHGQPSAAEVDELPSPLTHPEANKHNRDQDVFENPVVSSFAHTDAAHSANRDPLIRGTRAVDGTTGHGMGLDAHHGDGGTVKITPYGLSMAGAGSHGVDGSLAIDRQSMLATTSVATGTEGGSVSVTGGLLAAMGYAGVTVHNGDGTGVGGFAVLTQGGTPGVGMNITHAGALGSVAASPTVVLDKTSSVTMQAAGRDAQTGKDTIVVQQRDTTNTLGQIVLSAGHAGAAVVTRIAVDASRSKTYTRKVNVADARKLVRNENLLGRRLKALGLVAGKAPLPKLDAPTTMDRGGKVLQEVQNTAAMSLGVAGAGVQAMGGHIRSKKSFAEVTRGGLQKNGSASLTTVRVGTQHVRENLLAVDVPAIGSVALSRVNMSQMEAHYAVKETDGDTLGQLAARKKTWMGKGHFSIAGSDAVRVARDSENAKQVLKTFANPQEEEPSLQKVSYASIAGGRSVRVSILPLAASWLGPRAGLSRVVESDRDVTYLEATAGHGLFAKGKENSVHTEIPWRGRKGSTVTLLDIQKASSAKEAGAFGEIRRNHLLKITKTFSHMRAKNLPEVDNFLRAALPRRMERIATPPQAFEPPKNMDLAVEISMSLSPEHVLAVARTNPLLQDVGPAPHPSMPVAQHKAFRERALSAVTRIARSQSSENVASLLRSFEAERAPIEVTTSTNLVSKLMEDAAQFQTHFEGLKPAQFDLHSRTKHLRKILVPAAQLAKKTKLAFVAMQYSPLNLADASLRQEARGQLRSLGRGIAHAVTGGESKSFLDLLVTQAPAEAKALLEVVQGSQSMLSPPVGDNPQTDLFAAAFDDAVLIQKA